MLSLSLSQFLIFGSSLFLTYGSISLFLGFSKKNGIGYLSKQRTPSIPSLSNRMVSFLDF
jgi:hypothetical protein